MHATRVARGPYVVSCLACLACGVPAWAADGSNFRVRARPIVAMLFASDRPATEKERATMPAPTSTSANKDALIARLLDLHKTLLDLTRAEYEREHGAVTSTGALLQLVTQDPAFAWLRPVSQLIVALDDEDALAEAGGARALAERVFTAGNVFYDRYVDVLQADPAIVLAHAETMRAVKALPAATATTGAGAGAS